MQATTTMCECLNHDILPYMDAVMKPILECAQLKRDYGIASADSVADVQSFDDMGYV